MKLEFRCKCGGEVVFSLLMEKHYECLKCGLSGVLEIAADTVDIGYLRVVH